MTDLKKLRELAEKATPGPWYVMGVDAHVLGNSIEDATSNRTAHCQWTHNTTDENATYIAAANPQAIIELLDRLERYEKALEFYGNEKNWDDSFLLSMSDREPTTIHDECGGKRAREALEGGK